MFLEFNPIKHLNVVDDETHMPIYLETKKCEQYLTSNHLSL